MSLLEEKLNKIQSVLGNGSVPANVDDKLGWHLDRIYEALVSGGSAVGVGGGGHNEGLNAQIARLEDKIQEVESLAVSSCHCTGSFTWDADQQAIIFSTM